ncbi:lysophospholipid acyltransferase family protein [Roseovarius autotrophicus]|uniref:lysophospholipid acyltransferase family protein n=1 Tax=Roseovarius autotrophicus TaxID=2824121 RepID=UPI001B367611
MAKFILGSHLRHKALESRAASNLLWAIDLAFVGAVVGFFRLLPLRWSSALGARFGRFLGRVFKNRTRHVRANLTLALPGTPPDEIDRLAGDVWANAGAVFAEYPHLAKYTDPARGLLRIETVEPDPAYCRPGTPVVFVAAHLANWEVACAAMTQMGIRSHALYAPLANPWLDRILLRYRARLGCATISRDAGLRAFLQALRQGEAPAMIIDRRVEGGKPIPFFGADKDSSTLPAGLALRFGAPLVPVQVERHPGARFIVRFHAPLVPRNPEADTDAQALDLTRQIHERFEDWISARPGEWLCTSKIWRGAVLRAKTNVYNEA